MMGAPTRAAVLPAELPPECSVCCVTGRTPGEMEVKGEIKEEADELLEVDVARVEDVDVDELERVLLELEDV
jgi:hypothetical protein